MPRLSDRTLREHFERTMNPWYEHAVATGRIEPKYARTAPGLGLYSLVCGLEGYRYSDPDVEMQFQAFALGFNAAMKEVDDERAFKSLQALALFRVSPP